jgi:hypothetical protein
MAYAIIRTKQEHTMRAKRSRVLGEFDKLQEEVWDTGYKLRIMERKRAASIPP